MTSKTIWAGLALAAWALVFWMAATPGQAQRLGLSRGETLQVVQQAIREAQLAARADITPAVAQALNRCTILIREPASDGARDDETIALVGDLRC